MIGCITGSRTSMHLIISFVYLAYGTFSWGPCPSIPSDSEYYISRLDSTFGYSSSNFNVERFLGTWYEVNRNIDFSYEKGNCSQAYYYVKDDGSLGFLNSEIVDGKNKTARGKFYCDDALPGQCYAQFSRFAPLGDYKIIETDFSSSALVFSCVSIGIAHWKWIWVLSRTVGVAVDRYYDIIPKLGIPLTDLMNTNYKECNFTEY